MRSFRGQPFNQIQLFLLSFLNPLVSASSILELLFGNVSFHFVLDPDVWELIYEEV